MGMEAAPKDICLDLSEEASGLCRDLCRSLPELRHIDTDRILFCLSRSRSATTHGTLARIAPLRFAGGSRRIERRRRGRIDTYCLPDLQHRGREILYVIYLMMPRFLRLDRRQKLETIIHELFHISPAFDGDIRRFPGRHYAHGSSRRRYDAVIAALADAYLATDADAGVTALLQLTEEDWSRGRLRLTGMTLPLPRARLVASDIV